MDSKDLISFISCTALFSLLLNLIFGGKEKEEAINVWEHGGVDYTPPPEAYLPEEASLTNGAPRRMQISRRDQTNIFSDEEQQEPEMVDIIETKEEQLW